MILTENIYIYIYIYIHIYIYIYIYKYIWPDPDRKHTCQERSVGITSVNLRTCLYICMYVCMYSAVEVWILFLWARSSSPFEACMNAAWKIRFPCHRHTYLLGLLARGVDIVFVSTFSFTFHKAHSIFFLRLYSGTIYFVFIIPLFWSVETL